MIANTPLPVAHQFDDAGQQRRAATLGMWIFLATEVVFFGALFLAYTIYRILIPEAFNEASGHTLVLAGSINTGILLLSSFTMVLAVEAAASGQRRRLFLFLATTAALGVVFLILKGFEYHHEITAGLLPGRNFHSGGFADPAGAQLFFYLYFLMTGVHALHVTIGVLLIGLYAVRALLTRQVPRLATPVDMLGLYWHFVDIVWVFLFPMIYLTGRHL